MTITLRVLHGACRGQSAPAPRMPSRRFGAAYGRAMAAIPDALWDLVPANAIV